MLTPDLYGGMAALLYLLYFWLQLRTRTVESFPNRRVAALTVPAMGMHLIYVVLLISADTGIHLSVWSSAIVVSFVATVSTFYLYLILGYRVLALVIVPLTILTLCCGLLFTPSAGATISQPSAIVHVLISMLAYATLALAAIQALSIIVLHRQLKKSESNTFMNWMPPLQTVESTNMHLLWLGVSLLTMTIVTGFYSRWNFVQQEDYRLHMGLAVTCWILYLALVCGQLWFGWRGLISARLSLLAFAMLLVGYFGLKFVLGYGT